MENFLESRIGESVLSEGAGNPYRLSMDFDLGDAIDNISRKIGSVLVGWDIAKAIDTDQAPSFGVGLRNFLLAVGPISVLRGIAFCYENIQVTRERAQLNGNDRF
jgi:hypothetical protein